MTARARMKLTASDYRRLPEGGPLYQLVDGDLVMSPSPRHHHQKVVGALHARLWMHVNARGLGEVVVAPDDVYIDDENVLQPDVYFVAAAHADRFRDNALHGAPDLVVEVLSPSTRALDLVKKRVIYAAAGVVEAWYVDIEAELILVYRLQENAAEPVRAVGRGGTLASALVPGFEIGADAVIDGK